VGADVTTSFWADRPTLLTGATGLVGAWTLRRLVEAGADVVCLVRDWVPGSEAVRSGLLEGAMVARGDVRDRDVIERVLGEYEVDTVLHLAAQTIVGIANRNPVSTFETNVAGTWAVMEACRRSPRVEQVVLASSDKAYGEQPQLPYREDAPLEGRHPYDVSKSCADLIATSYAVTYDLPVVITRCGNFFGGGDLNWNRIVPGTIRSVLRGQRPVIRSDGSLVRDYFYVEDGAAAYMLLAERLSADRTLAGEAFNFSNEEPLTVAELVERVRTAMDSSLEPEIRNEARHEILAQSLSAEKARRTLGWRPLFTLDEGLTRTVEWYRSYLQAT
jgi:CDP-glucose 4,6-dehydratase